MGVALLRRRGYWEGLGVGIADSLCCVQIVHKEEIVVVDTEEMLTV
jgi:hypothetical protein